MSQDIGMMVFGVTALAFLAGWHAERWRARWARVRWRRRDAARAAPRVVAAPKPEPQTPASVADPLEQLRIVMQGVFTKRKVMSAAEYRVFHAAEKAVRSLGLRWRVLAQVSLGEALGSPDPRAYAAINSKRADVLIISGSGEPILAVEFQGEGHYQGAASARDAVKKEALRRAGVHYFEVTPAHGPGDLAREIARIAAVSGETPARV